MILIIGGAYQGKSDYAKEHFNEYEVVRDFHKIVYELVSNDIDPCIWLEESLYRYKDKVILCDDIFCSIVPISKIERVWREELGRALAILSRHSDTVIRMFCGIPTIIK